MYLGNVLALLLIASNTYQYAETNLNGFENVAVAVDSSIYKNENEEVVAGLTFDFTYNYQNIYGEELRSYEETQIHTRDIVLTTKGDSTNNDLADLTYFWVKLERFEVYYDGNQFELNVPYAFIEAEFTSDYGVRTYFNYQSNFSFYFIRQEGNINTTITTNYVAASNLEIFLTTKDLIYTGFNEGFREGIVNSNNYNLGYLEGLRVGEASGYENGFQAGREEGLSLGFEDGKQEGLEEGFQAGREEKYSIVELIQKAFSIVVMLLQIEIFPGIYLAAAFGIPLILAIVFFVLRWFR